MINGVRVEREVRLNILSFLKAASSPDARLVTDTNGISGVL